MAITRLLTTGWDITVERQFPSSGPGTTPVDLVDSAISNAASTLVLSQQSITMSSLGEGVYWTLGSAIAQCRLSMMANMPTELSGYTTDTPGLFTLGSGGLATKALTLYIDNTFTMYLYAGATSLGSFNAYKYLDQHWHHWGIDFKIDAASGWCNVYVDGTALITYSGQTDYGATTLDTVCVGPDLAGDNWPTFLRIDNVYFDNTTGEGSAAVVPMSLFGTYVMNGNGNYSEWVGSDGNSVNNYLQVDDALTTSTPANAMTDYNQSAASGDQDSYAFNYDANGITSITGIEAVKVCVVGIEEAGTTEQFRPFLRYSGTDLTGTGVDFDSSANGFFHERFTSPPGGGSWTKSILDATEIGIEMV